tara:strand:+ start:761 stop:1096 length:336 start_codon:yes stop_codon:yes gene_type:complete
VVFFQVLIFFSLLPTARLSVVRRQGNFLFPSAHEAKAFGLVLFFLSKAKSIRFSDFINIHRPFDFALKSALRLGIVTTRFFSSELAFPLAPSFYCARVGSPSATVASIWAN